jgi:hypothetical protein
MWTEKHDGEIKTFKLKQDPMRRGLGTYDDIDGNKWDVWGVFGHSKVRQAYPFGLVK